SLAGVGWFERGPLPGQPGDAVIDGHYGLPSIPAVFRNLQALEPGDALVVIWPDGRQVKFRVTSTVVIARNAPQPSGLFGAGRPPPGEDDVRNRIAARRALANDGIPPPHRREMPVARFVEDEAIADHRSDPLQAIACAFQSLAVPAQLDLDVLGHRGTVPRQV